MNNLNAILAAMISSERLEPPAEIDEVAQHKFIMNLIFDICYDITRKGNKTNYQRALDALYEHILENVDRYKIEDEGDV